MTLSIAANAFTVTKYAANRFLVEGVFPINGGRVAPEAFSRVMTTKAKAEALAAGYSRNVMEDVMDFLATRARRVEIAQAYCATRAARAKDAQLGFAF